MRVIAALLLCLFLCSGCASFMEWAQGDKDGDGVPNAEEAADVVEAAGGVAGLWWAPAALGAGVVAAFLRGAAKKKGGSDEVS